MHRTLTILIAVAALAGGLGALDAADEGDDAMLETGDRFPTFSLTAHDGSTVSSAELFGSPFLIYFYPKADTPGCTREACEFRDSWDDVQAAGLQVFGVSYDSPKTNRAFAEKYELPFLLLSDGDKDLAKAVGASSLMPFPKRISYLVGADGTVVRAYPKVSPAEHASEVLADASALNE